MIIIVVSHELQHHQSLVVLQIVQVV